jgi:prepilin-type N-terminal cleavage/methylation domain-containing protein
VKTAAGGFTLVELALVITIVGVLAWIAYPKFASVDEIKLHAAARRVAGDLRYAQSRSIGTRVVHGVLFEPAMGRYTVFAPGPASPVVDPADRSRPLRVDFARMPEYRGVVLASAAFGAGTGVEFDFFGVPLDTAGTELPSPGRVVLTCQGLTDTVVVASGTGAVEVR